MTSINFLDPNYYDVDAIPADAPNKALLVELYERMNEQNERLFYFFTEMVEDPGYKPMRASDIKPRTLRKKTRQKSKAIKKARAVDEVDSPEFMEGYKEFMKDEFQTS